MKTQTPKLRPTGDKSRYLPQNLYHHDDLFYLFSQKAFLFPKYFVSLHLSTVHKR